MVAIEEIVDEDNDQQQQQPEDALPASQERKLDAEAIEQAAAQMTRVSARLHLEALAKRLRKESDALARVEQSQKKTASAASTPPASKEEAAAAASSSLPGEEKKDEAASPPPPPSAPVRPPTTTTTTNAPTSTTKFTPIDKFAFDAGGYNAPFVTLYVELAGVGAIPRDQVSCQFTAESFDFVVRDLNGKSYRLFKDNLEKAIDPKKSKLVVKANKVLIKLAKVKQGEYGGYEYWSQLTEKKTTKSQKDKKKDDPQASIMELMKNMYDEGDDNMKKMIGETMMKQQRGELGKDGGMPGMPGGGMGGGDFGAMDDDF